MLFLAVSWLYLFVVPSDIIRGSYEVEAKGVGTKLKGPTLVNIISFQSDL